MNQFKDFLIVVMILMSIVIAFYSFWLLLFIFVGYVVFNALGLKRNLQENGLDIKRPKKILKKARKNLKKVSPKSFDDAVLSMNRRLDKFAKH